MSENTFKRIFRNTAVLTGARLFSRILQFFLFIYAARCLGVVNFGIFSFAYALVRMLGLSMDLGMSYYTVQQVSRDRKLTSAYLGASLRAKIFLILLGYGLIMGTGLMMEKDSLTLNVLFILATVTAFDNLTMPFDSVFNAHEQMQYQAIIISVSNCLMSAIGFVFLYFYQDLLLFCAANAIGAFLRMGMGSLWCMKLYGKPARNFDFSFIINLIKNGIPFSLVVIFVTIYYNIDSLILDRFCGSEAVGYYNAAYRLIEAPLFISSSLTTALFPAISRLYKENPAELKILISESFHKGLALGLSVALVTSFLSEELVALIYGQEYAPAARVLPILIFSVAFIMPGTICGTAIRATDRQSVSAVVAGGGAFLNILLNLIFVPRYASAGAAWSTLATEILVVAVYMELVRCSIGPVFRLIPLCRILALNALLLGFLHLSAFAGIWFQIVGCTLLFLPLCLLTGVVKTAELQKLFSKN
ncbi:MAG: flippase [Desulfobacterales bacterium]